MTASFDRYPIAAPVFRCLSSAPQSSVCIASAKAIAGGRGRFDHQQGSKKMRTALCIFALAICAAGPASAASYSELADIYNRSAFQQADDDWRRFKVNRIGECGRIGRSHTRRVDILVDRYRAIGAAMDAGSQETAVAAAKSLSAAIERNSRFGKCWTRISRPEGLTRKFRTLIADF